MSLNLERARASNHVVGHKAADILLSDNPSHDELAELKAPPVHCQITAVSFFASAEQRRLVLACGAAGLAIETSMTTAEIQVYEC